MKSSVASSSRRPAEDRRLARLTKLCLDLPESARDLVGSHARFHLRDKTFAWYLDDHHGDGIVSVSCKMATDENREVVALDPVRFYLPAYIGHQGWVAFRLDVGKVDWSEVAELVTESYRLIAPKRLAGLVAPARSSHAGRAGSGGGARKKQPR